MNNLYKAPALEKGLEIIELLAAHQAPLSMSEISLALGRSKNEIFRMLSVLVQKQYITKRDGGEKFSITNQLFELAMKVLPNSILSELSLPLMQTLVHITGQSCHISVLSQDKFVVVNRVESSDFIGIAVRIGFSTELLKSSSGLALLTWLNKKTQLKIIKKTYEPTKMTELIEKLNQFKLQGVVKQNSPYMKGITDLSVPIMLSPTSKIAIAALTVPFAQTSNITLPIEQVIHELKQTARIISKQVWEYLHRMNLL